MLVDLLCMRQQISSEHKENQDLSWQAASTNWNTNKHPVGMAEVVKLTTLAGGVFRIGVFRVFYKRR